MTIHEQDRASAGSDSTGSRHVVALVLGCLLLVSGISLLLGGGGLALEHAFGRDAAGYFSTAVTGLQTPTAAIIDKDLPLQLDAAAPSWLLNTLDINLRLQVAVPAGAGPLFIGIGPVPEVEAYLSGVAHDQIVRVSRDGSPVLRRVGSYGTDLAGLLACSGEWSCLPGADLEGHRRQCGGRLNER